jgi:hypothetical protein
METLYKEKIINEIDGLSDKQLEKIYKFIHLLNTELLQPTKSKVKFESLRGIWKGAIINDNDFEEAKRSLFPYDYNKTDDDNLSINTGIL